MSGFKNFILRGNLIELAVAFIMGAAFTKVVGSFTEVVMGFISRIFGGTPDFTSWVIWKNDEGVGIPIGTFVTDLIALVIVGAVVYYFIVLPYTKAKERYMPAEDDGPAEDIVLLTEIRDALANKS